MTDNSNLAGIERQAELRGVHETILGLLQDRFGTVPEVLKQHVRKITDEERLRTVRRNAVLSDSLPTFLEILGLVTIPPRRWKVDDNPFLARIERDALRASSQRYIIKTLEYQLGNVPDDLEEQVNSITDLERLDLIFDNALRFESLDAFLETFD